MTYILIADSIETTKFSFDRKEKITFDWDNFLIMWKNLTLQNLVAQAAE